MYKNYSLTKAEAANRELSDMLVRPAVLRNARKVRKVLTARAPELV